MSKTTFKTLQLTANSVPEPVGWWKFDSTKAIITADSAGRKDGVLKNNPQPDIGVVDDALLFDGINDYVKVRNHKDLNFGCGDFSVSTWLKTTDTSGVGVIIDKRVEESGPYRGFSLATYYDEGLVFQLADGDWYNYRNYDVTITDGNWHQITVTVDRDNHRGGNWYIDGKPAGVFDPTNQSGSISNTMPLIMGTRSDNSSWSGFFSSSLDEVKLFDEALDAHEVATLYNNDVNF